MEIMIVIQWICGISFATNLVLNIYKYTEEHNPVSLNAAMGWFFALMWVIINARQLLIICH